MNTLNWMGIERAKSFNVIFTTFYFYTAINTWAAVKFYPHQCWLLVVSSVSENVNVCSISITDNLPRISTAVLVLPQIQLPQGCRLPRYSAEVCIGIRPLFASPLEWIRTTTKATISSCFPKTTLKGHAHNIKNQTYHTKTMCYYPITWNDLNVICQIFFGYIKTKAFMIQNWLFSFCYYFLTKKKEST